MTDEFATPDASPRDYVPRGDAEARAKVPRDQWDRYLMPHLDGTKPARNKGFTRVSTIKSGLSNQTGIKIWTGEKIVEGLGQDTELVEASMRAAKLVDPEDRKRALRKIADRAFVVGGGKDRSGKGTEFHEVTEQINRGDHVGNFDGNSLNAELTAYYRMLSDNDVQILPDMLERQVLCPYNMAGTFDNMVRWWNPDTEEWELCIADLKTGRDLSLGWLEILMQLWSYANAYGLWTTTDVTTAADGTITDVQGYYEPMPLELRKDKALIFHVPLDGTATLYVLDLSGVERYVAAAVEAKRANAEAKHKVRKIGTVAPAAFVEQPITLTGADPASGVPLTNVGGYTLPQVGAAVAEGIMHGRRQVEPDGPWAPVRQNTTITGAEISADRLGPATFYPAKTADQIEQERKRDERLAKVAAMSNPNTDGDDEPVTPRQISSADNRSDGTPPAGLDPVTGRKKRTCGHCRKPGHTQKNCPENPASAKYIGPGAEIDPDPMPLPGEYVPEGEYLGPEESAQLIEAATAQVVNPRLGTEPVTEAELAAYNATASQAPHIDETMLAPGEQPDSFPWCHLAHAHEWTSTHPAAPGQWVCSTTGKPSREAYEKTASQGPYAQPLPIATMPPAAPPRTLTQVVVDDIAAASTQAELLSVRQRAIEAGHWVESLHNDAAMVRYQALA
jgi:hypothetical protein